MSKKSLPILKIKRKKVPKRNMAFAPSTYRTALIMNVLITLCYPTSRAIIHGKNRSQFVTSPSSSGLEKCQNIYRNLTQEQKARFVDASGKPGSGVNGGNTLWYGSYSECQKLAESRYCWTMFPGELSLVKNKTESHHFEWGVCVPNGCTNEDVKENFEFLFKKVSGINQVTPHVKRLQVNCAEDPEYTTSVVITIVFCGILVGLCLLATIADIFEASYKPHKAEIVENGTDISMDKDHNEKTPLVPNGGTTKVVNDKGSMHEILLSFSTIRNIKSIMSTKVGKSDLTYLHGIRVLSLFWIILVHVNTSATSSFFPYENLEDLIRYERRLLSLVLTTAYGVDTFFVLGGLLVMYTNLSKKTKNNGKTDWFKYYFHRFWRLTPTLMFFILFVAKLRPFFGAGPLWFMAADTSACSDNWWTNLLYLNNFIHTGNMCLVHTWYLAADMQFFVISPIFLLIAYRYGFRRLLCVVSVVVLASIIVTASIVADKDEAVPVPLLFTRLNTFFSNDLEKVFRKREASDVMEDVYRKPWCRIPPYVMGMVLGYAIYEHFTRKFKLPWIFVVMMWISATALALTDIYAPYSAIKEDPRVWSTGEEAIFWSLKWSIWSLCIIWLIFACHYNYAGLVKNILEAKFWIPLSHINYSAFIVHKDVIRVLVFNIETPIHYTAFTTVTYFLSSLVLTYAVAFIVAVVVELPFANLEALAWKKWEKK